LTRRQLRICPHPICRLQTLLDLELIRERRILQRRSPDPHMPNLAASTAGLDRLRKNSGIWVESVEHVLPGLKPGQILWALCGG
jgi:hypothetical protein